MATAEIPTPKLIYDSFFNTEDPNHPYKVEIDSRLCGVLLKGLGMRDRRITSLKIIISPQLRYESRLIGGQYYVSTHTIFYYPTGIWNSHQHLLAGLRLMTQDSTTISTAKSDENTLQIMQDVLTKDSQSPKLEKKLNAGLREFAGRQQAEQIMRLAKLPETLQDAETVLLAATNRNLRVNMAHELRHSKDKPPSRFNQEVSSITSRVLPFMLASPAISFVGLLPHPIGDGISFVAAIWTYFKARDFVPGLMYAGNFAEIKARMFAEKIARDPQYNNLVTTGEGWQ